MQKIFTTKLEKWVTFSYFWLTLIAIYQKQKVKIFNRGLRVSHSWLWHKLGAQSVSLFCRCYPILKKFKRHWCYCKFYTAAAKSLQSCRTLCDPINGSPPGFAIPGILQARTLEWVAISFSNASKWKAKVKSLSHVLLLATPMDCSLAGSSVHGIFQARVLEWGASSFSSKFYKIIGIRKEVKNVQYFILTYVSSKMFSVILSCTNHLLTFCF